MHAVNSHRTNFLHSLNSGFANNRLSHLAVPPQMLRQALYNITREITENGYALSIPLDELTFYYSKVLVTCLMDEISVSLHVSGTCLEPDTGPAPHH
jgi:hypothetical protein